VASVYYFMHTKALCPPCEDKEEKKEKKEKK
jgi:hypothetical protein